jgi:hypothetical protein
MKEKLETKVEHTFEIDSSILLDLDFNIEVPLEDSMKTKIIIDKPSRKRKTNTDASTRLF